MTLRQNWSRTLLTLTGLAALCGVGLHDLSMIVYTSYFLAVDATLCGRWRARWRNSP